MVRVRVKLRVRGVTIRIVVPQGRIWGRVRKGRQLGVGLGLNVLNKVQG